MNLLARLLSLAVLSSVLVVPMPAQQAGQPEPVISSAGQDFYSWGDFVSSEAFRSQGLRCGTAPVHPGAELRPASDCSLSQTVIRTDYDPTFVYDIPVVVHVIRNTAGTQGNISQALVQSQIDILNEDFRAIAGSNGENGTDSMIQFHLATEDPGGNPTNGITYTNNTTWFNDSGDYWTPLNWNPNRYLNIYTNSASGALGYVPCLPQCGGFAGSAQDRVVVLWSSFGNNAPIGPPYNKGRTTTHEVGHYLGLHHTFNGSCDSGSCYSDGDLVCDTEDEQNPRFGCQPSSSSCGSQDPVENYMDYSDDLCMELFTPEQSNRMRCVLEFYRPNLPVTGIPSAQFSADVTSGIKPLQVNFTDMSSGDITSWLWDFGDGDTSNAQHPTHTYDDGGLYTVSLTTTGPSGMDTETKPDYIDVAQGPPATFAYRNGSDVNPFGYTNVTLPIVGTTWETRVARMGAPQTFVGVGYRGPLQLLVSSGELLVQLPFLKPLNGGTLGTHEIPIPNDPALVSRKFWTQGATFDSGQVVLQNAIDICIGY